MYLRFITVVQHFLIFVFTICRPMLSVWKHTQAHAYHSIFDIYSSNVYPPQLDSIRIVSNSYNLSIVCFFVFFLFSFCVSIPSRRLAGTWRDARSVSLFHREISPVDITYLLSHPLSVYLPASSLTIFYLLPRDNIISQSMFSNG